MNFWSTNAYITKQGQNGIINFQYKGGSSSILYSLLWNPLCQYIVDHLTPEWVAPNVITLFAFLQLIAVHFLFLSYSPLFDQPVPQWLYFLGGISVLVYQILDNCDGKQARRTQNSSPLGMLFDHGCDSMTSWIIGLTLLIVMQAGFTPLSFFAILFITQISFYMAQWSQFHVGEFQLGYINGVDQGLVGVEFLFFLAGIAGPEVFTWIVPGMGIKLNEFILYTLTFVAIFQSGQFIYETYNGCQRTFMLAVSHLLGGGLLFVTYYLITYWSPDNIIQTHFYYIVIGLGLLWSNLTGYIQIAHIAEQPFQQWNIAFVLGNLLFDLNLILAKFLVTSPIIEEKAVVIIVLLIGILAHGHMVYSVCNHIADILGIQIFLINQKADKYNELTKVVEVQN